MRTMPGFATDPSDPTKAIPIPVARDWDKLVRALIARPLTAAEDARVAWMRRCNWTARVAAEDVLGRTLTTAEFASRRSE